MRISQNTWWIGVDLDGTLVNHNNGDSTAGYVGEPVPKMMKRVKAWIAMGYRVKIFTARCSVPDQIPPVEKWLEEQGLGGIEITNVKDYLMVELWDDRVVQVIENTGVPVSGSATRVPVKENYEN